MDEIIQAQKAEIDFLRERVRQLEDALMPSSVIIPIEWNLPRCEARLFSMLTQRDTLTKQTLHLALYGDRYDAHDYPVELVESHMSKLRKRLLPFGVEIRCQRFVGYSLKNRLNYAGRQSA